MSPKKRAKTSGGGGGTGGTDEEDDLPTKARKLFMQHFKPQERTVIASAPGRVNLIGEHTDYTGGFCLPVAVGLRTWCVMTVRQNGDKRNKQTNKVVSLNDGHPGTVHEFEWGNTPQDRKSWATYVAGVAAQYEEAKDMVVEAAFASDIPIGAGLSSSAALEVAFAAALEHCINPLKSWSPLDRALACVESDHKYVGVPCGIMDQTISSCGQENTCIFLDCERVTTTFIPFVLSGADLALLVVNTNVTHSHATGEYRERVACCEEAAAKCGVSKLSQVTSLDVVNAKIKDPNIRKRARHVVSENQRTLNAIDALRSNDFTEFGKLMMASHVSLRDDYEVSCTELDFIVDTSLAMGPSVLGARMTGGGFGGSAIVLVKTAALEKVENTIKDKYATKFGKNPTCFSLIGGGKSGAKVETITF